MEALSKVKKAKKKNKAKKKKGKKSKKKPIPLVSTNDLAAAARWVTYNGVLGREDEVEKVGAMVDELDEIRKRQRSRKIANED